MHQQKIMGGGMFSKMADGNTFLKFAKAWLEMG